jgi:hypothetical protein
VRVVSVGGSPSDARRSGASLGSPAAPTQVSRPASVTCAVSDRWSAKILNERGYPCSLRMVSGALAAYLVAATGLPATVGGRAVLDVLNDDRML